MDWPRADRQFNYQVVSLETLVEKDGWDAIEHALARRKRRGAVPNPTEEAAIARIMLQELEDLTLVNGAPALQGGVNEEVTRSRDCSIIFSGVVS